MKTQKYIGLKFETSSSKTPEFMAFARDFKADIKALIPAGFELASFTVGHFYVSGFVRRIATAENYGKPSFYFFSISDVRFFPEEWNKAILIRTAESLKDYTGGRNNSVRLADLGIFLAGA